MRFRVPLGWALLTLAFAGCGWNERETSSNEFVPIHFLNTDTLYYLQTKSTNEAKCYLLSGCEVTSSKVSEYRKCFSVRANREVACPASVPKLELPAIPDSIVFEGVRSRVAGHILVDNRVLGFATLSVVDYIPAARWRFAIFFATPGDTSWTPLAYPDSCNYISQLGPEARFYEFRNHCTPQGGLSEDSLQPLGTDPMQPKAGTPISRASLPEILIRGVIATDTSQYAGFLTDENGWALDGIGIYSAAGAKIASITAR